MIRPAGGGVSRPLRNKAGRRLDPEEDSEALSIFRRMVRMMPLGDGREIKKFETYLRKFYSRVNIPVATVRDERDRPLIWYAAEYDDPIAADLLLSLGAAVTAFAPTPSGRTPYQHAMDRRHVAVLTVFRAYAPRRSNDGISEDLDDLLATSPQSSSAQNCCCPNDNHFFDSTCSFSFDSICGTTLPSDQQEHSQDKLLLSNETKDNENHAATAVARSSSRGKKLGRSPTPDLEQD